MNVIAPRFLPFTPFLLIACGIIGIISIFTHHMFLSTTCVSVGLALAFSMISFQDAAGNPVEQRKVIKRMFIGMLAFLALFSAMNYAIQDMSETMNGIATEHRLERDAHLLYQANEAALHNGNVVTPWSALSYGQRSAWMRQAKAMDSSINDAD